MKSISCKKLLLVQRRSPFSPRLTVMLPIFFVFFVLLGIGTTQKAHAAALQAQTSAVPQQRSIANEIIPGGNWTDTSGNSLQAHGAGIIQVGDTYYWFGENRAQNNWLYMAISCYSSTDLMHWTFRNNVLTLQSSGDLGPNRVVERPKVIFNALTNKYVMYTHIDNTNYSEAKVGVATSDTIDGNYTYLGSYNPQGVDSRDMTVFQDTDGSAYLLYATKINSDLNIDKLSPDYLTDTGTVHVFSGVRWEAPAMFKANGLYYLVVSSPTGWAPNPNKYVTATTLNGTWSAQTSLAPNSLNTYDTQATYILPVTGIHGTTYIYMGDRWDSTALGNSRYVWLPLTFNGTAISLPAFYDVWTINTRTGTWRDIPTTAYEAEASTTTLSGGARIMNCSNCSGTKDVGFVGNNSGILQMNNISAPRDGNYLLTIYYANADGSDRTSAVSSNGGAGTMYTFASSHAVNITATVAVVVHLNAGNNNTISFFNTSTWAPDFDKITIADTI